MDKIIRAIGCLASACFQCGGSLPVTADIKTEQPPRFADYRLVDPELKIVGIDSDPTESFLALELDSAASRFAAKISTSPLTRRFICLKARS